MSHYLLSRISIQSREVFHSMFPRFSHKIKFSQTFANIFVETYIFFGKNCKFSQKSASFRNKYQFSKKMQFFAEICKLSQNKSIFEKQYANLRRNLQIFAKNL